MITQYIFNRQAGERTEAELLLSQRKSRVELTRTPLSLTQTRHTLLMESLNLNALAGSLPTSNLASAEKELLNNFRGNISFFAPSLSRSLHLRRLTYLLHCLLPFQSGRAEHNESLSILALNIQARVQLGLCRRLRRPASDDPTRRV